MRAPLLPLPPARAAPRPRRRVRRGVLAAMLRELLAAPPPSPVEEDALVARVMATIRAEAARGSRR